VGSARLHRLRANVCVAGGEQGVVYDGFIPYVRHAFYSDGLDLTRLEPNKAAELLRVAKHGLIDGCDDVNSFTAIVRQPPANERGKFVVEVISGREHDCVEAGDVLEVVWSAVVRQEPIPVDEDNG
jgi:hypothetical protein